MSKIKRFVLLVLTIILSFSFLAYGSESEWEKFIKLKERYYYLDKQQFNEISCIVEVPLIVNLIEQIKKQLAPLQEKVEIRENLSTFVLTYSPQSGLSFTDPEFDIILKNKGGIADPERVNNGINMMKNGFKMQVDGVKSILKGLFDDYSYPQKEKYKDLVVTKNREGFIVKYTKENNKFTETYHENTINTSQEGGSTKIKSTQKYVTTINKKLILGKGSASINQPAGNVKMDISIEYQDIGNIVFPKNIKSIFEQTIQSISQKGTFDIVLKKCETK
jgi:hypothetical protein